MSAMNLTSILAFITNRTVARTAAELRAALAEIDQAALERRVDELEAQRRKLLLTGTDAEVQALLKDLSAANLECERAEAASEELKRQIADAEVRERAAELDAAAAKATDAQMDSLRCFLEIHRHATALARLLDQHEVNRQIIAEANNTLTAAGVRDRRVSYPEVALQEHLGLKGGLPPLSTWQLPGYAGDPALVVGQKYHLARAAELLPAGHASRKSS